MHKTATFLLCEARFSGPGDFVSWLQLLRGYEVSAPAIARLILKETSVRVSAETVRRWIRALEEAAAA